MKRRGVILLAAGILLTSVAGAQEAGPRPEPGPLWGTSSLGYYTLHAAEFIPTASYISYETVNWMRCVTGGGTSLTAAVHLPTGALVGNMYAAVCDWSVANDINVKLWKCPSDPFTDACVTMTTVSSAGLDGCAWTFIVGGPFPFTVDNDDFTYFVEYISSTTDCSQQLDSVRFFYQLQVSPAPATATFGDVPTSHAFFRYVEALAASGITAGCGGGNFCPDQPVTRGQMAVFLAKALGLHWGT
jgi:hypothetical protein